MVMVDHIGASLRTQHHGDHMVAEKFSKFLGWVFSQVLAFLLNLAHTNRDLRRTQIQQRRRFQNWLTREHHETILRNSIVVAFIRYRPMTMDEFFERPAEHQDDKDERQT